MKHPIMTTVTGGLFLAGLAATPGTALAGKGMTGYQIAPAISSPGTGTCKVKAAKDGLSIDVELTYSDLEEPPNQAHVHLGQSGVTGGIVFFVCTNLGNGPVGTPPCSPSPATLTRTIGVADITSFASAQGIAAGEIDEAIAAIKKRALYCDVHTSTWPSGEIRQQLK